MANGYLYVNYKPVLGYPYTIRYAIRLHRTDKKVDDIVKIVTPDSNTEQEWMENIPPGNYEVTIGRTDGSKSPRLSKKVSVDSGQTASVTFDDFPVTHATVALKVKILPKGQDVKGLNFHMLTPWGGGDYRQFRTTAVTRFNRTTKYYFSNSRFETCPTGDYQITHTFPVGFTVSIPSPAGCAIYDEVSKTKQITVDVGSLTTAVHVYITNYYYGQSFYRNAFKLKNRNTNNDKFLFRTTPGTSVFNVTAGDYTLYYAWNFWEPNTPEWVEIKRFTVARNQIYLIPCWQKLRGGGGIFNELIEWQSKF